MQQKLVSIYMNGSRSTTKEEHLNEYLKDGWRITQVTALNGAGGCDQSYVYGWVFVVLEKE